MAHSLVENFFCLLPFQEEPKMSVTGERMDTSGYWYIAWVWGLAQEKCSEVTDHPDMTSAVNRGCKASIPE